MSLVSKVMEGLYSFRTLLIHGRFMTPKWDFSHHVVPPISSSTTFRLATTERGAEGFAAYAAGPSHAEKPPIYIYDRLDEPTRGMLEERLAIAERGDEIISHQALYGCTYSLLTNWFPRYGITTHFIDMKNLDTIKKAISDKTRILYFETPVNPTMELIDIRGVSNLAGQINSARPEGQKIKVIVDNTFATCRCQRPLELGADFSVMSLTKNVSGFGTDMGGAIAGRKEYEGSLFMFRKDLGAVMSPKNAWAIMVYGLPTLDMRTRVQQESAMAIAQFLEAHPKVQNVYYPGLESHPQYELARKQMNCYEGIFAPGALLSFVIKGDPDSAKEKGRQMMNHIADRAYTITLAVSLGQLRSLIEHPSSMTHAQIPAAEQIKGGIEPGLIRLSVGCESAKDIIHDLDDALQHI